MLWKAVLAFGLVLGFHSICSSFAADTPQAAKVWRIGFIANSPPTTPEVEQQRAAFHQALRERGYVEGSNLVLEWRFLEGKLERAPGFGAELVRLNVDVIVASGNPAVLAAKQATSTIPIVMVSVADPVAAGLVASLAHPGGNLTGLTDYQLDLTPKRLELLKATLPGASRVAVIRCLKCPARVARESEWTAAAQTLGLTLALIDLSGAQDLDEATAAVLRARPDTLFLALSPVNFVLRKELADFAMRERLPMFTWAREQIIVGGLMSYGPSLSDQNRKVVVYIDKILKGAKPGDLPIEQPSKLELIINLKTAKALGITIPQSLRLRADEVIE